MPDTLQSPRRPVAEQQRIVRENIGLAHAFAARSRWARIDEDELLSLAHEGLVRAARGFNPAVAQFSTYAWRCMQAMVFRHLKHARTGNRANVRLVAFVRNADGETIPYADERAACPVGEAEDADDASRVRAALATIDPRMARVVELRFIAGRTLEDIGAEMGVSKERVRQLQNMGLKACRSALEL